MVSRDSDFIRWVRTLPCTVVGWICAGPVEADHCPTRASQGKNHDRAWPLCTKHHRERHDTGIKTFQRKYGLNVETTIDALEERYVAEKYGVTAY